MLGNKTFEFNVTIMVVICGRNSDDMFFLTRDGGIEINHVGFPNRGQGGLYYYAWQGVCADSKEEFDDFGRNYIDRLFIRFCEAVFGIVMGKEETFKSLSCKKVEDRYIARLELSGEILESELTEMVTLLERRCRAL